MNESIFFLEVFLILSFAFLALKLGKQALTAWVAAQALIANLFVLKQINLFGLDVTATDAFAIGSLLGLNLLQEHHGKEEATKATWICFFFMFFFAIVSQLHLIYQPSFHDTSQHAYQSILSASPRLLIASMSVFFIVQRMDIRLFEFLKNKWPNANFSTRATSSMVISQLLDTILFSYFGLYGIVASVFNIIIISFLIKLIVIFSFTTSLKWLKT